MCDRLTPMSKEQSKLSRREFGKLLFTGFMGGLIPRDILGIGDVDNTIKNDILVNPISKEKLLPFETVRGVISAENMPVWVIPVTEDYFYNYWQNKKEGKKK